MKKYIIIGMLSLLGLSQASASAVLDLEGQYSLEGYFIRNALLDNNSSKFYFLHQLRLKPEIKVVDSLSVHSRLDLLTNPWSYNFKYKAGSLMGMSETSSSQFQNNFFRPGLDVTHLYFSWNNELIKLMGGRMPLHFGLGLLFDEGDDSLDHFADYIDGVGVEFKIGNLEIHPSFGLLSENLSGGVNAYEVLLQLQYELVDSGLLFGLMYDVRIATQSGRQLAYGPLVPETSRYFYFPRYMSSRVPTPPAGIPPDQASDVERWSRQTIGAYVKKDFPFGSISLEADFIFSSTVGIRSSLDSSEPLELSGYGIVAEVASHPSSSWNWGLKAGYLSGDDPVTSQRYEGFIANRNYNVGMLMFNHAIGYQDTIGGSYRVYGQNAQQSNDENNINSDRGNLPDVEYLTNAFFVAPSLKKSLFKKGYLTTNVVWASLLQNSIWSEGTNLGFEVDLGFIYESSRYLALGIEGGLLFPGAGFVGESRSMIYGVQANVIVSF